MRFFLMATCALAMTAGCLSAPDQASETSSVLQAKRDLGTYDLGQLRQALGQSTQDGFAGTELLGRNNERLELKPGTEGGVIIIGPGDENPGPGGGCPNKLCGGGGGGGPPDGIPPGGDLLAARPDINAWGACLDGLYERNLRGVCAMQLQPHNTTTEDSCKAIIARGLTGGSVELYCN